MPEEHNPATTSAPGRSPDTAHAHRTPDSADNSEVGDGKRKKWIGVTVLFLVYIVPLFAFYAVSDQYGHVEAKFVSQVKVKVAGCKRPYPLPGSNLQCRVASISGVPESLEFKRFDRGILTTPRTVKDHTTADIVVKRCTGDCYSLVAKGYEGDWKITHYISIVLLLCGLAPGLFVSYWAANKIDRWFR